MRIQLATLAMAALVLAPFAAGAETDTMPPDNQFQGGMMDSGNRAASQEGAAAEDANDSDLVNVEIVEIDGNRLIAETDDGEQLVFLVDGSADNFDVGDELALKIDEQAKTAVILKIVPQEEDEETES